MRKISLTIIMFIGLVSFASSQTTARLVGEFGGCQSSCMAAGICSPTGSGNGATSTPSLTITVPAGEFLAVKIDEIDCAASNLDNGDELYVDGVEIPTNDGIISIFECFENTTAASYDFIISISVNRRDEGVDIEYLIGADSGVCDLLLPVEYAMFEARKSQNGISLLWQTASEINNEKFEIQRSTDGKTYETIGTVNGNGTTSRKMDYTFLDKSPNKGMNYYRLNQIDFDGASKYSETISVRLSTSAVVITPTPTYDFVTIETGANSTIILRDVSGQLMHQDASIDGNYTVEMVDFPKGVYILTIEENGYLQTERVIKL